jgi:cytoskeletal protein CcmA (bactofilin family)
MEQELQNLRISGAGDASGGRYNEVRISGAGDIKGDLECNYLKTSGASDIKGNVKAKIIEISGASDIKGNVECEEMRTSGASDVRGNVTVKKIKISGASDIRGNLYAEDVEISGCSEVKLDCEAENFVARGIFKIGGLLNAGNINICVGGNCRVREIGGEHIEVRLKDEGGLITKLIRFVSAQDCRLVTEIIEGDNIYLEGTIAKVVRGNNITIGTNCEIDLVEYKNELKVVDGGKVKKETKI